MRLQHNIKQACEETGNATFYNGYSGRGMYGRTCIGITGDSLRACQLVIAAVAKDMGYRLSRVAKESVRDDYSTTDDDFAETMENFEDDIAMLLNTSMDSMGQGVILYWPELDPIVPEENLTIELHDADLSEG